MKIEEGMYCYNKINRKSGIGKIVGFRENNNAVIEYRSGVVLISVGNIIASYNIIDLIEEGDYVNGVEVIGKEFDNFNKEYLQCGVGDYVICTFEVKDIKSILTKEQYENNCYKVEDI